MKPTISRCFIVPPVLSNRDFLFFPVPVVNICGYVCEPSQNWPSRRIIPDMYSTERDLEQSGWNLPEKNGTKISKCRQDNKLWQRYDLCFLLVVWISQWLDFFYGQIRCKFATLAACPFFREIWLRSVDRTCYINSHAPSIVFAVRIGVRIVYSKAVFEF